MTEIDEQVQNLRARFLSKLDKQSSDVIHPADLNRVKTDDSYLNRFLLHHDNNIDGAFNMLWDTCEWRKKFGANDITDKNVNKEILELGSVFPYGKDNDGKTLLVFKSKKHYKSAFDFEDQKRCLVYWMERLERQENGEKISLFFDMDGAVLGNMDLEYTKYLISLFKDYYPHFLNYIIIFEMAWVLNAVFKVIKTLLPPKAVEKMKFVSKSNVKDYVDMKYGLKSWGGNDNYVFIFEPEQKHPTVSASGEDSRKKVHFADTLKTDQVNENGFEDSLSPSNSHSTRITATDVMVFNNEGSEVTSTITLKNHDNQFISYKIKTTAPEKFRVRPSNGTLAPGASSTVSVVLIPGYQVQNLQRDKFLILSIPIENGEMSQLEINDLWKQRGDKEVRQHKIQCSVQQLSNNDTPTKSVASLLSLSPDEQKDVAELRSEVTKLNMYANNATQELKLIKQQQWIILLSLFILISSLIYVTFQDSYYSEPHNSRHHYGAYPKCSDN